ncbi:MAG: lytic transglycosylase domain-containing protein [Gorillibacterium sp.]|nr:lytic transglycosylase domain-containing protein [Gorillibacterium sp.]
MSMDPRVLSQLLRMQIASSPTMISGGSADTNGPKEGASVFNQLLDTLLANYGSEETGSSTNGTIPAEYSNFTTGAKTKTAFNSLFGNSVQVNPAAYGDGLLSTSPLSALSRYQYPQSLSKPSTYDSIIAEASAKYGVDLSLIKAVIDQESSFNPLAESSAGAKGLMQLMDKTAEGLGVKDSFDAEQNINGGTKFLAYLLDKYNGDEAVALAAYNGGPGRVDRLGISNSSDLTAKLDLLPQETQAYVQKVLQKKSLY